MNTKKEAASPLLTGQPMPSGSGVCRAMLRGRPSSLEGDDASLARPACRPALDPGDLYGPWGRWCGQARACPGDRRGTPITTYRQDQKAQNYMIEISTVSGDCPPTRLRVCGVVTASSRCGGQGPGSVVVVEAEVEQSA